TPTTPHKSIATSSPKAVGCFEGHVCLLHSTVWFNPRPYLGFPALPLATSGARVISLEQIAQIRRIGKARELIEGDKTRLRRRYGSRESLRRRRRSRSRCTGNSRPKCTPTRSTTARRSREVGTGFCQESRPRELRRRFFGDSDFCFQGSWLQCARLRNQGRLGFFWLRQRLGLFLWWFWFGNDELDYLNRTWSGPLNIRRSLAGKNPG